MVIFPNFQLREIGKKNKKTKKQKNKYLLIYINMFMCVCVCVSEIISRATFSGKLALNRQKKPYFKKTKTCLDTFCGGTYTHTHRHTHTHLGVCLKWT